MEPREQHACLVLIVAVGRAEVYEHHFLLGLRV